MPIAVTPLTACFGRRVTETSRTATLTELTFRPVKTPITFSHTLQTRRMVIARTVHTATISRPSQIANALKIRRPRTVSMDAGLVARAQTVPDTIAVVTLATFAAVRPVRIATLGLFVAVVQTQLTLIHIRTLGVGPTRPYRFFRHVPQRPQHKRLPTFTQSLC